MPLEPDFMPSYDRESIIAELRRVAALTGRNKVTVRDLRTLGRISSGTVAEKFGSFAKAHEAAGLDASHLKRYTNEELLKILADLWTTTLRESGRSPVISDIKKYKIPVSARTISDRFGGWTRALMAASEATHGRTAQPFGPVTRPRGTISPHTRFLVFKRDLYTCQICRRSGVELVLDHVIPVCQGGSDLTDNLQALCVPCNQGKAGHLQ